MKQFISRVEWISDYYVLYFLYNPNKIERYYQYMVNKWHLSFSTVKDLNSLSFTVTKSDTLLSIDLEGAQHNAYEST